MTARPLGIPRHMAPCNAPGCETLRGRYSKSGQCRACRAAAAKARRGQHVPCITPGCGNMTTGRGETGQCKSCTARAVNARPEVVEKISARISAAMTARHAQPGFTEAAVARMNAAHSQEMLGRAARTRSMTARAKAGLPHVDDLAWQAYQIARRDRIDVDAARRIALDDFERRRKSVATDSLRSIHPSVRAKALELVESGLPVRRALLEAQTEFTRSRWKKVGVAR